jgi:hypothetical protein
MRQSAESLVASTSPVAVSSLEHIYTSAKHHFSFKYPDAYTVRPIEGDDGDVVLIENETTHKGIQIAITLYSDPDTNITADRVRRDVPDLAIANPQPLNIGGGNSSGLAFESNNPAFGGASREVWFVFGGELYQISAYAEYDALLRAIFATWNFKI